VRRLDCLNRVLPSIPRQDRGRVQAQTIHFSVRLSAIIQIEHAPMMSSSDSYAWTPEKPPARNVSGAERRQAGLNTNRSRARSRYSVLSWQTQARRVPGGSGCLSNCETAWRYWASVVANP
jgi:hypothetical protein